MKTYSDASYAITSILRLGKPQKKMRHNPPQPASKLGPGVDGLTSLFHVLYIQVGGWQQDFSKSLWVYEFEPLAPNNSFGHMW